MKFVLVTQNAPIYLPIFLDRFFTLMRETDHRCLGIVVLSASPHGFFREVTYRWSLYGPVDFLRMSLKITGEMIRSHFFALGKGACHSTANVIRKHDLTVIQIASINKDDFIDRITKSEANLLISIASPQVFRSRLLKAPPRGCINYHSALLPRYRGIQPLFWALLNEENEVGVTVHEMDRELDNGPILVQRRISVDPGDSLDALYNKTFSVGPEAMIEALDILERDNPARIENPESEATYFGFPQPKDLRLFRKRGKKLF